MVAFYVVAAVTGWTWNDLKLSVCACVCAVVGGGAARRPTNPSFWLCGQLSTNLNIPAKYTSVLCHTEVGVMATLSELIKGRHAVICPCATFCCHNDSTHALDVWKQGCWYWQFTALAHFHHRSGSCESRESWVVSCSRLNNFPSMHVCTYLCHTASLYSQI